MPDLRWPLSDLPNGAGFSAQFVRMLTDTGLSQLITEPTRFRINQTASILDLLVTNDTSLVSNISYLPPVGKSDHVCIHFNVQFSVSLGSRTHDSLFSFTDYDRLASSLSAVDWRLVLDTPSVDQMWRAFMSLVKSLEDAHTKLQRRVYPRKKPWISHTLMQKIRIKRALWQRFRRSNSQLDYALHRRYSNRLASEINLSKSTHLNNIAANRNKKSFFKHIRSCLNSKVSTPALRDQSGTVISDDTEVANLFVNYFNQVFTVEPPGAVPTLESLPSSHSLEYIHFSPSNVQAIL